MHPAERAYGGVVDILKPLEGDFDAPLEEEGIDRYLFERYLTQGGSWKRRFYYAMKPLLPRAFQIALRRRYLRTQAQTTFPSWPVEPIVVDTLKAFKRRQLNTRPAFHWIGYWPKGYHFACVLTHDVEWDAGLRRAPELLHLERTLGFHSSCNIVPERYPIDVSVVEELRALGSEIGIHGLRHDGRLFQSHSLFSTRMAKINAYAREWKAVGFRSPSTLRNAAWMTEMSFVYDSSFPDTDPYEPQPGGCCTIWPYFIGKMVELPMTMPQDHTLFEIHRMTDISVWEKKATWISENGGLLLVNVHPDYMLTPDRLELYRKLLLHLKSLPGMWHVRPRDLAQWWLDRHATRIVATTQGMRLEGPAADRAVIFATELHDGEMRDVPLMQAPSL